MWSLGIKFGSWNYVRGRTARGYENGRPRGREGLERRCISNLLSCWWSAPPTTFSIQPWIGRRLVESASRFRRPDFFDFIPFCMSVGYWNPDGCPGVLPDCVVEHLCQTTPLSGNFATLGQLELLPPFTGASIQSL